MAAAAERKTQSAKDFKPDRFDVKIERLKHAFDIRHRTTVDLPGPP
jgi:hypothetical protein